MSKQEYSQGLSKLKDTLDHLLDSANTALVIGINGEWGSGKTYFWKKYIQDSKISPTSGYVSVFGCESLEGLRRKVIFEAIRQSAWKCSHAKYPINDIGLFKVFPTAWKVLMVLIWHLYFLMLYYPTTRFIADTIVNSIRWIFKKIPEAFHSYIIPGNVSVDFMEDRLISEGWILCIDDIERISEKLNINELSGYISQLRDEMKIKIILIYNGEKINFSEIKDKLIDREVFFKPVLKDLVLLAFSDKEYIDKGNLSIDEITNLYDILKVYNIRNMRKSVVYINEVIEGSKIDNPESSFISQVVRTIILACWAAEQESSSLIGLRALRKLDQYAYYNLDSSKIKDEEKEFYDKVNKYGYSHTDDLDIILINFLETGLIDYNRLEIEYKNSISHYNAGRFKDLIKERYDSVYHNTLKDNSLSECGKIFKIAIEYSDVMSLSDVDGIATTFSDMKMYDHEVATVDAFINTLNKDDFYRRVDRSKEIKSSYLEKRMGSVISRIETDTRDLDEVIFSLLQSKPLLEKDTTRFESFSKDELCFYFMERNYNEISFIEVFRKILTLFQSEPKAKRCEDLLWDVINQIAATNDMNRMRMSKIHPIRNSKRYINH